ncbi:pentapeptide repeat-containing protein [Streptomyces specialis]|uniref:pentapeptide repeat-containing protein n=1 Tax=Streptomyces specialis TaxID=498367 RepID=UPI00073F25E7|nr:pentapeptide repeat-containing protein [Streptomyces specialis]
MHSRTLGRLTLTLPTLDALSHVTSFDNGGAFLDFHYTSADPVELSLTGTHFVTGRITGLSARRSRFDNIRLDSVEFTGCDLTSLRWTDSRLTRTVFRDCKLTGAVLERLTLDNVLFEGCTLTYAVLAHLRATGPLALVRCDLTEAAFTRCDLSGAHLEACGLRHTTFTAGTYHRTDLRGNNLSALRGAGALKQVIIDRPQHADLTHALTTELDIAFPDTLDDPPATGMP